MSRIKACFDVVHKQRWLWLLPVVLSLGRLLLNMLLMGEWPLSGPGLQFRATIPASIPEIGDMISPQQARLASDSLGIFVLLLAVMLFKIFLSAGYLAGGMRALRGEPVDMPTFWADCQHFFKRVLLIGLLLLFAGTISLVVLAAIHPIVALVAAFVAIIYLFFWEIAVVYEDLDLREGFTRGHTIMRAYLGEVTLLLIAILSTSGIVSPLLNWLAQYYLGYLIAILIWSSIGASLFVAVIRCYCELVDRGVPDIPSNELV